MKITRLIGILLVLSTLTSCVDQINIEDISLALMIGIDLDEEENLIVSSSNPVFYKEAKEKEENTTVKAVTIRDSREELDASVTALSRRGKLQVVLIAKKVLKHKNWFNIMDTIFRDGKNTTMSRVVVVDGPVSDVMSFKPKDKPRLPLYVLKMVDTTNEINISMKTTMQDLHRQFTEKGVTPYITEMEKTDRIVVKGTSLLDHTGKYKFSLDTNESKLLKLLQDETGGVFSFTLRLLEQPNKGLGEQNKISFFPTHLKINRKVDYKKNQFEFNIAIKMGIVLTERLFEFDVEHQSPELEKQIEDELLKQINELLKKIQGAKIDPMGLGLYARAFQYKQWKEVQDNWGKTLSQSKINVKMKVKIEAMGSNR